LKELQAHDHSVVACAFNPYHDQLVLSTGTDGCVALWRASSTSSVPLMDSELGGEEEEAGEGGRPHKAVADSAVDVQRSHEDSITDMAWSACTAWLHGTVSHSGKVVFGLVPQAEKLKILMV
jgi:WD40 repeat protein